MFNKIPGNLAKKNKCRALTDKTYFGLSYHVEKKNLSKQNVQNYVAKTERKKNQTWKYPKIN